MGWVQTEKKALAATLRRSDPLGDTLCAGWDTRRLLAHLVQREQDHLGAALDALARPEPGRERNLGRLVAGAATPEGYTALVDRFVAGPSRWSPFTWAAEQVNLLEYVIHHEDVRRGGPAASPPRVLPAQQNRAVWKQLPLMARLRFRTAPVGVVLAVPAGARATVKGGTPAVTLSGEPVELALHLSGRRSAAHVQLGGPPETVATFRAWLDRS
jgi:uncharacterized protein (TIGR03085 family)